MPKLKNNIRENSLLGTSDEAKKFWGKGIEDKLPKPVLNDDLLYKKASDLLIQILSYARGAESRGEWLFRHNYLHPLFEYLSETNTEHDTSWQQDNMGNMYVQVGEVNRVLHVGHIDTVHDDTHSPLQHINIEEDIISLAPVVKHSIPQSVNSVRWINGVDVAHTYTEYTLPEKKQRSLGADDGCAIATMLFLIINEVPGTYLFTRGEEIGCVGTHYIIDNDLIDWSLYDMAIEVDRKGTDEIVCDMSIGSTASKEFVASLSKELGMGHKPSKGTVTDVAYISGKIPECVNISAGYMLQHSERETTNWKYLDNLTYAMLLVDWDNLVISRKAGDFNPISKLKNKPKSYTNWGVFNNYTQCDNSYGDFVTEPSKETRKFEDMFPLYTRKKYVQENSNFILEFLETIEISPSQMHDIIQGTYGVVTPEEINPKQSTGNKPKDI